MYHYVRTYNPALSEFRFLHMDDFKKQLDHFESVYGFLSPNDLLNDKRGQPLPQGVILTFDDGLKDHYTYVLPELKKRNISGIFYVNTAMYSTGKLLGVHRLHLLLGRFGGNIIFEKLAHLVKPEMLTHMDIAAFRELTYTTQVNDSYTQQVKRMLNYFIGDAYCQPVLDGLMQEFFPDEEKLVSEFYLTVAEMKEMQQQGMIIGSHTATHPVLSKLTYREQQLEIENAFELIEQVTGSLPLRTFCYPYGGFHSFTMDTEQILTNEKVAFSFSVEPRDITPDDLLHRPQALPRYDCNMFPFGKIYQRTGAV